MRRTSRIPALTCLFALGACAAAPDPRELEYLRDRILIVEDDREGGGWLKLDSAKRTCRIDASLSPNASTQLELAHRAAATRTGLFITLWHRGAPGTPPIVMRLAQTPDPRLVR